VLDHQHNIFKNRMDELFHIGSTSIRGWEIGAWYGLGDKHQKQLLDDVRNKINEIYNKNYGFDGAEYIRISQDHDKLLFLRDDSLLTLDQYLEGLEVTFDLP